MPISRTKLNQAINTLSKYFGLHKLSDLSAAIALDAMISSTDNSQLSATVAPREVERRIIELLIDTSEGAYTTAGLIRKLNDAVSTGFGSPTTAEQFFRALSVYHSRGNSFVPPGTPAVDIAALIGDETGIINQPADAPSKVSPGLAVYIVKTAMVGLQNRNINPVVVFLNGIPNVEMSRAVPYVDVRFYWPKSPLSTPDNRLQTTSTLRFLLGAEQVAEGSVTHKMVRGNIISADEISSFTSDERAGIDEYTVAGMELFTTPQTLINASNLDESLRSNLTLDKFRPFLSLDELNLSLTGTTGFGSYKSGQLKLILHDRSRLSEIADLIRADLYSTNEIVIEYGWMHPDSEANIENPYADIINGMRVKEKYMVSNSSFTFDDSGQVIITLSIAMRGSTDMHTCYIDSNSENMNRQIQAIEDIQRRIGELRQRYFTSEGAERTREVRGAVLLDTAQDAMSNLIVTREMQQHFRNLSRALRQGSGASEVLVLLERIYGDEISFNRNRRPRSRGRRNSQDNPAQELRRTINQSIQQKVEAILGTDDPWLPDPLTAPSRRIRDASNRTTTTGRQQYNNNFNIAITPNKTISLAKLLLYFVGQPLANTSKFDDIQLIFYPFNSYAGKASSKNIGNFEIDALFFAQEFARWRLSTVGRNANMSLQQFIEFLRETMLDDPAAISYGLNDDPNDPLYQVQFNEAGVPTATVAVDEPTYQERLNAILREYTPDGSFKMPIIDMHMECVPVNERDERVKPTGDEKTCLRIHFFDRNTSIYETVGSLMASIRDTQLDSVAAIPTPSSNTDDNNILETKQQLAQATLAAAERYGLVERIENSDPAMYRIVGGPKKLKEFVYSTVPYIIYGSAGSNVLGANFSSIVDSSLATVMIQRSFRREESTTPNGESPGGLPMKILPAQLGIDFVGCPLLEFAQQFFIDFQTGTTVDAIYGLVNIDHTLSQGNFKTTTKWVALDTWGKYEPLIQKIGNAADVIRDMQNRSTAGTELPNRLHSDT